MSDEADKRKAGERPRIQRVGGSPRIRYKELSYEKRRRIYNAILIVMDALEDRAREERGEVGEKDSEESGLDMPKPLMERIMDFVEEDQGPAEGKQVVRLERTCLACPSSWNGQTEDGAEVFIRYRWGTLRVDVDDETVYKETLGDRLDGYMEYQDLKGHLTGVLALPAKEAYAEDWEANWGPILGGDK